MSVKNRPTAACSSSIPRPRTMPPPNAAATVRAARWGFSRTTAERGIRAHSGHLIPTGV
jgi:hypothetical protein